MKENKGYLAQLLIYGLIGMAAACITGYFLYQDGVEKWRRAGRNTFRQALIMELHKHSGVDIQVHSSSINLASEEHTELKKEPIRIAAISEYGKKEFVIPYEKHLLNIEQSRDHRLARSFQLEGHPLQADSLNMIWNSLLVADGYRSGRTAIDVVVSDWDGRPTHRSSGYTAGISRSDSLTTCYLGYLCEVEVKSYLHASWWTVLTLEQKLLLSAIMLVCLSFYFIQDVSSRLFGRFFVKNAPVYNKEPANPFSDKDGKVYCLDEDTHFDFDARILSRGGDTVSLTVLPSNLLRGFLEAEDYRLTNAEIMDLLWPHETPNDTRLYTAVTRLKRELAKISDWTIENQHLCYQLKRNRNYKVINTL